MGSSTAAVVATLEKITCKDKDFRYMATSDLLNELNKDTFKVDGELEKKLSAAMLTQLEDASGDISGLAVKCLGLLVRKIGEPRAEELARSLSDKVLTGKKDQLRDIASIGLKTVIAEIPGGSLATTTTAIIAAKMLEGIAKKESNEVVMDAMDILCELLTKFGGLVPGEHARIKDCTLAYLGDSTAHLRKRAMHCLAAISVHLSDELLAGVIKHVLAKLAEAGSLKADVVRSYTQAAGQVSRAVGYRFGRYVPTALPLIVRLCDGAAEGDDELRELCLQALESFVLRCPLDCRLDLNALLTTSLKYMRYDPNFADDMDEDNGDGGGSDDGGDEDAGSEEEYSDDEDMSWKVRRASAKIIAAAVQSYPDAAMELYWRAAEPLVARFREREENVLQDVFGAYVALCQQVAVAARGFPADDGASPLSAVAADVPATARAVSKVLKAKSAKTRIGVLGLLRELAAVLPAAVAAQAAALLPGVLAALHDRSSGSSALKIEALAFLRLLLASNPPSVFHAHARELSSAVFANAGERYYKVAAEALRVCEALVVVMTPAPGSPVTPALKPLIKPLFDTIMQRLCAQDQDQEVKEAAIIAIAALVAALSDELGGDVPTVLKVLLERLRNEVTRLPAVRALAVICGSSRESADLRPVLEPVLVELTSFLRKANRMLRQASLQTLEAITSKYGTSFDDAASASVVEEAAALVTDAELPLASLSLRFLVKLLAQQPKLADMVVDKALPQAMALVRSPLLQGAALEALQAFFAALAASSSPAGSCEALLPKLLATGTARDAGRQAQRSVAQCVAVLSCAASKGTVPETVSKLLEGLGKGATDGNQRLALLCLGEIGRRTDLSSMPQVETAITSSLSSESEDTKVAASLAVGGIACGNLPHYMPSLLRLIAAAHDNSKQQYLLLQALGEVISTILAVGQQKMDLSQAVQAQVLQLLLENCDGEEECRNVVAECLGRLALLHPDLVLGALQQRVTATSANMRAVVVSAIKYTAVERPHPIDDRLSASILSFLSMMSDTDRNVRKAAVVSLSATARHKAHLLVSPHVDTLLPLLYKQTVVRPDMVRVVDLGPFKHTIDDGLELRKAAFECLDILLDACRSQIDPSIFIQHLESGLQDHYDVKMPAHLLLAKLAATEPSTVVGALERLVGPLEKTLTAKVKSDAVKQEMDRHEDMLRSCLRTVDAINCIPGTSTCVPFKLFLQKVVYMPPLKEKFQLIQKERAEAEGDMDTI